MSRLITSLIYNSHMPYSFIKIIATDTRRRHRRSIGKNAFNVGEA